MIFLGIRYLRARLRQTLLTFLGIFFGATAYVAISGFFLGFQNYLTERLINNDAHVHILAREEFLTEHVLDVPFYGSLIPHVFWTSPPSGRIDTARVQQPQAWYRRLEADPRVEAYSPQLTAFVILTKTKSSIPANLVGCNPNEQSKVTTIATKMVQGQFSDIASGGNRLIIGLELMKRLGVRVSQNVMVALGDGIATPFKVIGIFSTGEKMSDLQAYGSLQDVQRINGTPNQVNEIAVRLKDYTQATAIATNWSTLAPEKIESWDQRNSSIFSIFRLQNQMRYMMIATILIVAGFGIYNVLQMTVTQKKRDIAILRSMGYSQSEVTFLFFSQGLLLGVCGAVMGIICGYGICRYLQTLSFSSPGNTGTPDTLHISLQVGIYFQAAILAIVSSSVASFLPARAAGRLTPIEIIRAGAE